MTTTLRHATEADIDRVAPLFDAYRRFYGQPADLPRASAFLRERLQRGESVLIIAEREGAIAGFTQLYPMFSSVRADRVWVLNDLYVDAGARRQGVARALLDAAAGFARDDGALRLELETTTDNHGAQALYEHEGWQRQDSTLRYHLPLASAT